MPELPELQEEDTATCAEKTTLPSLGRETRVGTCIVYSEQAAQCTGILQYNFTSTALQGVEVIIVYYNMTYITTESTTVP